MVAGSENGRCNVSCMLFLFSHASGFAFLSLRVSFRRKKKEDVGTKKEADAKGPGAKKDDKVRLSQRFHGPHVLFTKFLVPNDTHTK